ncbi:hypothetical protein LXA43DRAFT_851275, partial [Ganoderma leucocontextum]
DPEEGYTEDLGVPAVARRGEVRIAQQFVALLKGVTLDATPLSSATIERLLSRPRTALPQITPFDRVGIRMFLARGDASEANYQDNRAAFLELHPEDAIPSYEEIKNVVADVTGIDAIRTDMCVNTCVAFTGPFADARVCPECSEPR